MKYKILNLEEHFPTVEQALALLEIDIEMSRREGVVAMKVIHGYGSHGVGGEIKKALQTWLRDAKRNRFITEYVLGEQYTVSLNSEKIKILCPEILGDTTLYTANPGITIILL